MKGFTENWRADSLELPTKVDYEQHRKARLLLDSLDLLWTQNAITLLKPPELISISQS